MRGMDHGAMSPAHMEHGMSGHGAMTGFLGPYVMTREASGTSWQPDTSPHEGLYRQLEEWLKTRPSDALFDTSVEVLKVAYGVLPLKEREDRIREVVQACHEVAEASGGLGRLLGLGDGVSGVEEATLDDITRTLRSHG